MVNPTTAGLIAAGVALTPTATQLLVKMLGPAADAVGQHFGEKLERYLLRNRHAVLNRTAEFLDGSQLKVREVPMRLALPILEGASREDHAEIQELWGALLANAATSEDDDAIPPLFATILRQMTPLSARVLRVLAEHTEPPRHRTVSRPKHAIPRISDQYVTVTSSDIREELETEGEGKASSREQIEAAADILVAQGLATRDWLERATSFKAGEEEEIVIRITQLGLAFARAVEPPQPPAGT